MTGQGMLAFLKEELGPRPFRAVAAVRVTVAALLVMLVMLVFRMPLLGIGPYLVFLAMQRDSFFSRLALVAFAMVFAISSVILAVMTWAAWDEPWLRVAIFGVLLYVGYYVLRTFIEPRLATGPLAVLVSVIYVYDEIPNPNLIFGQIGWLWAIYGTLAMVVLLVLRVLPPPSLQAQAGIAMRDLLVAVERAVLAGIFGRKVRQGRPVNQLLEDLRGVLRKAAMAKELSTAQAGRAAQLATGAAECARREMERAEAFAAARAVRKLRLAVLRALPVDEMWNQEDQRREGQKKPGVFPPDFWSNGEYSEFALRATLATLLCYLFMTAVHWNGIHTCMVTCVITALASAEARAHKQRLRIAGALLGGLVAFACAIWVLPRVHDLAGFVGVMAAGTWIGAWLANGSERYAYVGLQFTLAFYLMLLQAAHATTELTPVRDRWVGIVVGTLAMWASFRRGSSLAAGAQE